MPYFFHVAVQILQKIIFLTDCEPNRAVSLESGRNDVCMVLSIEYLWAFPGAAGFYLFSSVVYPTPIKTKQTTKKPHTKNPCTQEKPQNKQKSPNPTNQSCDQTVLDRIKIERLELNQRENFE